MKKIPKPRLEPIDRFWAKVQIEDPAKCWKWTAGVTYGGWSYKWKKCLYPNLWVDGRNIRAHRWAYERFRRPIPHGLEIDHKCNNSLCVNPWHLQPITKRKNVQKAKKKLDTYGLGA